MYRDTINNICIDNPKESYEKSHLTGIDSRRWLQNQLATVRMPPVKWIGSEVRTEKIA
jgi:hypothetical protein